MPRSGIFRAAGHDDDVQSMTGYWRATMKTMCERKCSSLGSTASSMLAGDAVYRWLRHTHSLVHSKHAHIHALCDGTASAENNTCGEGEGSKQATKLNSRPARLPPPPPPGRTGYVFLARRCVARAIPSFLSSSSLVSSLRIGLRAPPRRCSPLSRGLKMRMSAADNDDWVAVASRR